MKLLNHPRDLKATDLPQYFRQTSTAVFTNPLHLSEGFVRVCVCAVGFPFPAGDSPSNTKATPRQHAQRTACHVLLAGFERASLPAAVGQQALPELPVDGRAMANTGSQHKNLGSTGIPDFNKPKQNQNCKGSLTEKCRHKGITSSS